MRLPAKTYLPAALGLVGVTLLALLVPSATADPRATGAADLAASTPSPGNPDPTVPTTSNPTSTWIPNTTWAPNPPCTTTTTPTPPPQSGPTGPRPTAPTLPPTTPTAPTLPPSTPTLPPSTPTLSTTTPQSPTVTSVPHPPGENIARGGYAAASSSFPGYQPARVNDGNTDTALSCLTSWTNDAAQPVTDFPAWVSVRWLSRRSVSRVVLWTTVSYELRDFDVQVLNPSETWWDTVATYNYNRATLLTVRFTARETRGVRVLAKVGPSHQPAFARINEIQVFSR
ncbi:hypothetical protein V5P93_002910 [Actinokineospora auranticolor]|uniref:F5/8 type C domain-containing protein n=1 Tax=Actinokineospora auranticolor TaxID=155976 RepID=A0A2S6H0T9_9PSEU|nr:hypothetical protein [Actinokineospora auranticolor]PPK71051.1 hypothetical protein CLV40_101237 [Actinokineospora auranticolor]